MSKPKFWESDIDDISLIITDTIEQEVYDAIKELLTTENPDFLLWIFEMENGEPTLHLHVEGREFPDIRRSFKLSALVEDYLEGRSAADGSVRLDMTEKADLVSMALSLRREADRIDRFVSRSTDK